VAAGKAGGDKWGVADWAVGYDVLRHEKFSSLYLVYIEIVKKIII
jgi:hypothetical protein